MKPETVQSARKALFAVVLFGLVSAAYGATLHVANNGGDGASCGAAASPCRSITQAIANAADGNTIMVGPGRYGQAEETPAFGGMLTIAKPVIVLSSDGAAATVIDARGLSVNSTVLILTNDAEFGRPDHGFTVTTTSLNTGVGIEIFGTNVKVRGNQFAGSNVLTIQFGAAGIKAVDDPSSIVLIEQNQAFGWDGCCGILVSGAGKKVSKNQVFLNRLGILADGGSVAGNVATANSHGGISLKGAASAVGNATYSNSPGFDVSPPFTGVIQKNNIFGNSPCGLTNNGVVGLVVTNNYWGAATGPGPNPADAVCNQNGGTTTTTPFALKPFAVDPQFEP